MGSLNHDTKNTGRISKIHPWLVACRETFDFLDGEKDKDGKPVFPKSWILTDKDLVFLINERLSDADKVSQISFEKWKRIAKEEKEKVPNHFKEFRRLYKRALLIAKMQLLASLHEGGQQWQRFAWILERKFPSWKVKSLSDEQIEDKLNNEIEFQVSVISKDGKKGKLDFDTKTEPSVGGVKE